jgi:Glycosyl hydrolase family 92
VRPPQGKYVDVRMSFCKGITQGGSNADTLLADAYIKGIVSVPWDDAFRAIQKAEPFQIFAYYYLRMPKLNPKIGVSKAAVISLTMIV